MNRIINGILNFMVSQKVIENDEKTIAFYRYGIEITISSVLNVVLVLLLGVISKRFIFSCIYLAEFIIIRSFSGGLHAKTYVGCNAIMCAAFIILIIAYELFFKNGMLLYLVIMSIISLIIMAVYSPCDNPHKRIKPEKKMGFKMKSIAVTFLFCILGIVLFYIDIKYGVWIVMVSLLVSLLLLYAVINSKCKMK